MHSRKTNLRWKTQGNTFIASKGMVMITLSSITHMISKWSQFRQPSSTVTTGQLVPLTYMRSVSYHVLYNRGGGWGAHETFAESLEHEIWLFMNCYGDNKCIYCKSVNNRLRNSAFWTYSVVLKFGYI